MTTNELFVSGCQIKTTGMQSETANFAPVPPPGELDETYTPSFILAQSLYFVKT